MSYLDIRDVVKSYDNKNNIIKKLTLSINSGEFLVIVGPSGCGKSTLLRMIAGLEDINSGEIEIDGVVVNNVAASDRDIAMVFQNYALYPHMNVEQNLSYGLKNRKIPKDVIKNKVDEIAELLQIKELLKRKPSELSGGQKQRVAMGRAIIREPKVFLFDEPLSNLDAKLRHQMRMEIRKLHNKLKITSVYVTHDQIEAMTLADRIVIINKGIIEQVGTPDEIYDNPQTLFVSQFMGTPPMNIFRSKIKSSTLSLFTHDINIDVDFVDEEVYLGIRAEDIFLQHKENTIKIEVNIDMIERIGSENLIYVSFEDKTFTIKTNEPLNKNITSLEIYIDISKLYYFSIKDEKRLN